VGEWSVSCFPRQLCLTHVKPYSIAGWINSTACLNKVARIRNPYHSQKLNISHPNRSQSVSGFIKQKLDLSCYLPSTCSNVRSLWCCASERRKVASSVVLGQASACAVLVPDPHPLPHWSGQGSTLSDRFPYRLVPRAPFFLVLDFDCDR
jgi:hypothetical protein